MDLRAQGESRLETPVAPATDRVDRVKVFEVEVADLRYSR
jgi:hypothetical protein